MARQKEKEERRWSYLLNPVLQWLIIEEISACKYEPSFLPSLDLVPFLSHLSLLEYLVDHLLIERLDDVDLEQVLVVLHQCTEKRPKIHPRLITEPLPDVRRLLGLTVGIENLHHEFRNIADMSKPGTIGVEFVEHRPQLSAEETIDLLAEGLTLGLRTINVPRYREKGVEIRVKLVLCPLYNVLLYVGHKIAPWHGPTIKSFDIWITWLVRSSGS